MKRIIVQFLRTAIILIALATIIILIRFPLTEGRAKNISVFRIYADPFILYGYAVSILFFIALYKLFRLLGYIAENQLFTAKSVNLVKSLKLLAIGLGVSLLIAGFYITVSHDKDDDPVGFLAVCAVAVIVSVSVATAATGFEKKLRKAINRKP